MKKFLLLLLFVTPFTPLLQAQDSLAIEDILNKDITEFYSDLDLDIQTTLYKLLPLGLDSFDLRENIFMNFIARATLQTDYGSNEKFTIQRVIDSVMVYREDSIYRKVKTLVITSERLMERVVTKSDWINYTKPAVINLIKNYELVRDEDFSDFKELDQFLMNKFEEEGDHLHRNYKTLTREFQLYQNQKYRIGYLVHPPTEDGEIPSMRYETALPNCKDTSKPIILYFTGYGCVNARKIEEFQILNDPTIFKLIKNNFYFVSLYVDDRKKLSEMEQQELSDYYEKTVSTIGDANTALQIEIANSNSQPLIVIIDRKNNVIIESIGYENIYDIDYFYEYLKNSLDAYQKRFEK